jgi:hypothetical protein
MLIKSVLMDSNEGLYIDLADIQARLKRLESSSSSKTDYPVKVKSPVQLGETKTFYAWKLSVIGTTEATRKVPNYHVGGIYKGKYTKYLQGDAVPVYEASKNKVQIGSGTYTFNKGTNNERTETIPIVADVYTSGDFVGYAYGSTSYTSNLPTTTDHVTGTTDDVEYKEATNEEEVTNIDDTPYYNVEGSTDLHALTTPKALKDATVTFEEDTSATDSIYKRMYVSDIVFYTTELPDFTVVQSSVDSDFPQKTVEVIADTSWETTSISYRSSASAINTLIYTNIPVGSLYTFAISIITLDFNTFKSWLDDTAYRVNGYGIVYGEPVHHTGDTTVYVPANKITVYGYGWYNDSAYYELANINVNGTSYGNDFYLIDNRVSTSLCAYSPVIQSYNLVNEQTFVASFEAYQAKYATDNSGNLCYDAFTDAPEASDLYKAAQSMANKNFAYYAPANFFPENLAYKATGFSSVDSYSNNVYDRVAKTYFPLFMKNDAGIMKMLADVEYDVESIDEAPYYKIKEARYNPTLKGNSGLYIELSSDIYMYSSYPTGFVDFAKFAQIKDTLVRSKFLEALGISSFVGSNISLERVPSLDTVTSCEGLFIIQQDADTYHSDYNGTEKVYYAPSAGTETTMDAVVNAEKSSVVH